MDNTVSIAVVHEIDNLPLISRVVNELVKLGYETDTFSEKPASELEFFRNLFSNYDAVIILKTSDVGAHDVRVGGEYSLLWSTIDVLYAAYKNSSPSDFAVVLVSFDRGYGIMPNGVFEKQIDIYDRNSEVGKVASVIQSQLLPFLATRDKAKRETKQRIEQNLASYVDNEIKELEKRSKLQKYVGIGLNFFGLLILLIAVALSMMGIKNIENNPQIPTPYMVYLVSKNFAVLAILFIACKYAFTLGKSYTDESLKIDNRIHAMSFGRFYLKAFGNEVTRPEVREVFQHWNITSSSTFASLETSSFDPKVEEKLAEVAKTAIESAKDWRKGASD